MTSTTRRITAGAVALVGVLLATTGCQSRVGTAATVGNETISVGALHAAFDRQFQLNAKNPQAGSATTQPGPLEQQTLTQLIQYDLLRQLAKEQGITISQGDIDAQVSKLKSGTGGGFDAQIPAADQQRYAELTLLIQALERKYTTGGKEDVLTLRVMQVKDAKVAATVAAQLQADPSQFDALARTNATAPPPQVNPTPVGQLPPQLAAAQPGQVIVVPAGPGQGPYVVYVQDRTNEAALKAKLAAFASQAGVKVNPRFGSWSGDQLQVVAASGGPVITPTRSAAPTGSPAPGEG